MSSYDEATVRAEVRAWLAEHWDINRPLVAWRKLLAESGWGMPHWPREWYGRGLPVALLPAVEEEFEAAHAVGVARIGIRLLQESGGMPLAEKPYPLLAAGDLQQFAVERLVPIPRQTSFGKSAVEGDAMAVSLGIGQRAIDIEYQGFEHGRQDSAPAPISNSHAFLWQ